MRLVWDVDMWFSEITTEIKRTFFIDKRIFYVMLVMEAGHVGLLRNVCRHCIKFISPTKMAGLSPNVSRAFAQLL